MTLQRTCDDGIGSATAGVEVERKLWAEASCPLWRLTAEGVTASSPLTAGQVCIIHSAPYQKEQKAVGRGYRSCQSLDWLKVQTRIVSKGGISRCSVQQLSPHWLSHNRCLGTVNMSGPGEELPSKNYQIIPFTEQLFSSRQWATSFSYLFQMWKTKIDINIPIGQVRNWEPEGLSKLFITQ